MWLCESAFSFLFTQNYYDDRSDFFFLFWVHINLFNVSHHIHTRFHVAGTFGVLGKLWLGYQIIESTVNFESIAFNVTLILFFYKIFCCEAVKALPNPQNWLVWDLTVKDFLSGQVQIESMLGNGPLMASLRSRWQCHIAFLFCQHHQHIIADLVLTLFKLNSSYHQRFEIRIIFAEIESALWVPICELFSNHISIYISINISIRHFFTGMWVRTTSACD